MLRKVVSCRLISYAKYMSSIEKISSEENISQLVNNLDLQGKTISQVSVPKTNRLTILLGIFIILSLILGGVTAAKYGVINKFNFVSTSPTPSIQSDTPISSTSSLVQSSPTIIPNPTKTLTLYRIECNENQDYVVIEGDNDDLGTNFLVKYKTSSRQIIGCSYVVENNDFEIVTDWRASFWEFSGNLMILNSGSGPPPRGMIIYDLNKRQKVFEDLYNYSWTEGSKRESLVVNNAIEYWSPIDTEVTPENCPEYEEYNSYGFDIEMEAWVLLDLNTMTKKELGEYRCSPRQ